jgi:hypothetical protein
LVRAIVNLAPYTFADDLADDLAEENENEQRTDEEFLLSTIDCLTDDGLTGFAIRLALSGHRRMPREGEFDFLTETENAFNPPRRAKKVKRNGPKKPIPIALLPKPAQRAQAKKPKPSEKNTTASSAPSLVTAQTPWLPHADSCRRPVQLDEYDPISPPRTSLRCLMNRPIQATTHKTKVRRWTTFTPPERPAARGALWPSFAPALIF